MSVITLVDAEMPVDAENDKEGTQVSAINWIAKGDQFRINHEWQKAVDAYSLAINMNSPDISKNVYAETWLSKGEALHKLGNFDGAIKCVDMALKISFDVMYPYIDEKCECLVDANRTGDALKCYDDAIVGALDHNDRFNACFFLNDKANYLCSLGRYNEAMEVYDKAIEMDSMCESPRTDKKKCSILRLAAISTRDSNEINGDIF